MSDAMTYGQVMRRWQADGKKLRSLREEVAQLEEKLQKCEDDFEECAGVGMQLDLENAALKHKLGLCETALRVAHLPLPPYDTLLTAQESG